MIRQKTCELVTDNIVNIGRELNALRDQSRAVKARLDRLERRRDAVFRDAYDSSSNIGRVPRRRDRLDRDLDIVSAIGQVLKDESSRRIQSLESEISDAQRRLERIEGGIRQRQIILRDQQGEFNGYECYDLGFSHEVLNVR